MRGPRRAAAVAVAVLLGVFLPQASSASAAPPTGSATVQLAGTVNPPAPDANQPQDVTIPLRITNTSEKPLYDVGISSLRSAPITTGAGLTSAFAGDAIEESDSTTPGPRQAGPTTLGAGATVRVDYRFDTSSEATGICLCFQSVYALDLLVTAADAPDGDRGTVARTQTYLPSLLGVSSPVDVGWLWPLLDRPHRLTAGSVFTDDDLAASVSDGGRLDRALQTVERVDAAETRTPGVARSMLLLLDPEILDELITMTRGYTVQAADTSAPTPGTGGTAASEWLARLAAVVADHDVRFTAPSDPDLVAYAARGVAASGVADDATTARIAAALRLPAGRVLPHDLAWPVEADLNAGAVTALRTAGATRVVTTADTEDDGALVALTANRGATRTTPGLLADPALTDEADAATGLGADDPADALQRLVVRAAMTSVQHPSDTRLVLVVPARGLDVDPAAAARAVLATTSLGTPTSPLTALAAGGVGRPELLAAQSSAPPGQLAAAVDAAAVATTSAATVRTAVVSGADTVVGDLPERIQRAGSNSWAAAPAAAAARSTADLTARADALSSAVQVVVRPTGGYSLASADAPLLLTVANNLAVAVRVRVDVTPLGRTTGFQAGNQQFVELGPRTRQTVQVPTRVTRSGRFEAAVSLRTRDGTMIGSPATITVNSTAVGAVGQIVTYSAGALLFLALLVRGVRRLFTRSRAGSDGTGPDPLRPEEGRSPVSARES
ncbi:DUF6049 family protein [Jatrophihabitans sp. YIM 134969]